MTCTLPAKHQITELATSLAAKELYKSEIVPRGVGRSTTELQDSKYWTYSHFWGFQNNGRSDK